MRTRMWLLAVAALLTTTVGGAQAVARPIPPTGIASDGRLIYRGLAPGMTLDTLNAYARYYFGRPLLCAPATAVRVRACHLDMARWGVADRPAAIRVLVDDSTTRVIRLRVSRSEIRDTEGLAVLDALAGRWGPPLRRDMEAADGVESLLWQVTTHWDAQFRWRSSIARETPGTTDITLTDLNLAATVSRRASSLDVGSTTVGAGPVVP